MYALVNKNNCAWESFNYPISIKLCLLLISYILQQNKLKLLGLDWILRN